MSGAVIVGELLKVLVNSRTRSQSHNESATVTEVVRDTDWLRRERSSSCQEIKQESDSEDSEDELASCPACDRPIPTEFINEHLDNCLSSSGNSCKPGEATTGEGILQVYQDRGKIKQETDSDSDDCIILEDEMGGQDSGRQGGNRIIRRRKVGERRARAREVINEVIEFAGIVVSAVEEVVSAVQDFAEAVQEVKQVGGGGDRGRSASCSSQSSRRLQH